MIIPRQRDIVDEKNIFHIKSEDVKDGTKKPELTEVKTFENPAVDISKMPGNELFETIYEVGHTFRNTFQDKIDPTSIMSGALNNIPDFNILSLENGLSQLLDNLPSSKKTTYSFKESEEKLKTKNLDHNPNPIGVFSDLLSMIFKDIKLSDNDTNKKRYFYETLNYHRKKLYNLNTEFYDLISSIVEIYKQHNIIDKCQDMKDIFNSNKIFNINDNVKKQIINLSVLIDTFYSKISAENHFQYVEDSALLLSKINILLDFKPRFFEIITVFVFNYVYEDLKFLRLSDLMPTCEDLK